MSNFWGAVHTFHPRFIISLARQIVTVSPPPYTGHKRSRKVIFISRILLFVFCGKRIFEETHGFRTHFFQFRIYRLPVYGLSYAATLQLV